MLWTCVLASWCVQVVACHMSKAILCMCNTCKVKIARGFLLYELGTTCNSGNDPGGKYTWCTCAVNLFFFSRGRFCASRVLLMGFEIVQKYGFGMVFHVYIWLYFTVLLISWFWCTFVLQMTFISNYSFTLNILNKNIYFQLSKGKWETKNFLASSVISGYLSSRWIKFSFHHVCF